MQPSQQTAAVEVVVMVEAVVVVAVAVMVVVDVVEVVVVDLEVEEVVIKMAVVVAVTVEDMVVVLAVAAVVATIVPQEEVVVVVTEEEATTVVDMVVSKVEEEVELQAITNKVSIPVEEEVTTVNKLQVIVLLQPVARVMGVVNQQVKLVKRNLTQDKVMANHLQRPAMDQHQVPMAANHNRMAVAVLQPLAVTEVNKATLKEGRVMISHQLALTIHKEDIHNQHLMEVLQVPAMDLLEVVVDMEMHRKAYYISGLKDTYLRFIRFLCNKTIP